MDAATLRFRDRADKFQRLSAETYQTLEQAFAPYMDDAVLNIVARLDAGTGSVNMGRYYFLVGPADYQGQQDLNLCHIVEVKQQRKAAPLFYFDDLSPVNRLNPAHLTLECQRRMQRFPDLVLDEAEYEGQHWLVSSRHHAKVGLDPENVALGKRPVRAVLKNMLKPVAMHWHWPMAGVTGDQYVLSRRLPMYCRPIPKPLCRPVCNTHNWCGKTGRYLIGCWPGRCKCWQRITA
ncbi:DUF2252 family protein [Aliamphritea spongicola]|nr:DUF2252 family protein [Aliamphritea spongicola]